MIPAGIAAHASRPETCRLNLPEERRGELAASIEHVRPLAGQALLAVFRRTMDEEVEPTFDELARRLARGRS
jgi:hypothetical protein